MHKNKILFLVLVFAIGIVSAVALGVVYNFGAQDLRIDARTMSSYQLAPGDNILSFDNGFDMVIGDNHFKSSRAIVWVKSYTVDYRGISSVEHNVKIYFEDKVSVKQGKSAKTSGIDTAKSLFIDAESLVSDFVVTGEVFVTADTQTTTEDVRTSQLYRNALIATGKVKLVPVSPEGEVGIASAGDAAEEDAFTEGANYDYGPRVKGAKGARGIKGGSGQYSAAAGGKSGRVRTVKKPGLLAGIFGGPEVPVPSAPPQPKYKYPINISSLSTEPVRFSSQALADGTNIATILNRFYLWQKQDEKGGLMEFQADAAVIFYDSSNSQSDSNDITGGNTIKAVYFYGNVVMTEGLRTIKSDELYYNFGAKQALAVNAVMRTYDTERGIPIYLKAAKLRQLSETKYRGNDIVLTNSEFYTPAMSLHASEVIITDTTNVDAQTGQAGMQSYDAVLKKVKLKLNNRTVFGWPQFHTSGQASNLPIRKISAGKDGDFGSFIETEWYMARVLGVKETPGVDSSLYLDTYSKRGTGAGFSIEYEKPKSFGNVSGYVINDKGSDDLGRYRQNVEPPRTLRGNFKFQHRQYLPYNWQLTLETSYMSDENFAESYNRQEFMSGKEEETLVHLKRSKDDWAFSVMGKWRINDFADQLEELPSAQYHIKGRSLFNDKFTLYSDSSAGSFRQRIGDNHDIDQISQDRYYFGENRTELDMPLKVGNGKVVPFIAGSVGFDDRSGFARDAVTSVNRNAYGSTNVFIGEFGTRASTQYWKLYRNVHSELWDVNGIRHIIKPYANIGMFAESDPSVEQKDYVTLGALQRLQTKRGVGDKQRIVDWMRLDTSVTMIGKDEKTIRRPDKFIWNNSIVPLSVLSAPEIFNGDLSPVHQRFERFGPQRDSFNSDYIWRVSDSLAILSDMNYDIADREIEQYNIGFSKLCLPNLSYYVGARYMRSTDIDSDGVVGGNSEKGTNAVTFAVTYKINPRYTLTLAHQYDYDYGKRVTTQVSLIRRYHRLYYGLTMSQDDTLDRKAIVLSIWPDGASELSMGSRNYSGLEAPGN